MKSNDLPDDALVLVKIEMVHFMVGDDIRVLINTVDGSGDEAHIVPSLGLIETAKALLINDYLSRSE